MSVHLLSYILLLFITLFQSKNLISLRDLNRIIYWNYKEVRRLNINDIIPEGIKERGRVKEKYIDISKELFNLTCDGEVIIIPKKVDLDIYGNEVKSLALPFEECLAKFEHFVQTNGRYPQMNASAEEVALRKWYREIGHGIITITAAQKTELYSFTAQYPDINKGK